MSEFLTLALAAVLLRDGMPHAKRIDALKPYFNPPPGGDALLDSRELRDYGPHSLTQVTPSRLRGRIKVTPPKGQCFILRGSPDEEDQRICKPGDLVFSLGDIDRAGRLSRTVITGEGDFGTEVAWQTPYRLAIVEPQDSSPEDPPQYLYVARCEPDKETVLGRRIRLSFFGGLSWSIRLPAVDELLPQPEPLPNLYIAQGGPRGGIPSDGDVAPKNGATGTKQEGHGETPKAEEHGVAKENEGSKETAKGGTPEKAAEAAPPLPIPSDPLDDRKEWSIPLRDSFDLKGDMFSDGVHAMRGVEGICRYRYDGPDEDPHVGRIECHNVAGYRMLFAPLTCIRQLKPL